VNRLAQRWENPNEAGRQRGADFQAGASNLNSEVEEGFLRSGAAKGAVPPVGMTDFGWWMMQENPRQQNPRTGLKTGHYRGKGGEGKPSGLKA
jgi:hypothetical protein